jgi:uncharacterized protein (TIGR02145 family)
MRRFLYIPRRVLTGLGYGALYNFYCTQEQHKEVLFGYLYNWYAATDSRNIASDGWHMPTDEEWTSLTDYAGGLSVAGTKLKDSGSDYWNYAGGTDDYGFSFVGSGYRIYNTGEYTFLRDYGYAWTSGTDGTYGYYRLMGIGDPKVTRQISYKNAGLGIRLLKDSTTLAHGQAGTYTGNDGKTYKTICIGTQEWLASNLMETKYRDGSLIAAVTDNTAWAALTTGARCSYNNLESNAGTTKKLAPVGWHVPSKTEYRTLSDYLGGNAVAGGKLKEIGLLHWDSPNTGADNSSGFTALASGKRTELGVFQGLRDVCNLWNSNTFSTGAAVSRLSRDSASFDTYDGFLNYYNDFNQGMALRFIKDTSDWTEGETVTDSDGNIYATIKIGTQVFIASNYTCTKWNDGTPIANVTDNAAWAALTTAAYCWYNNNIINK